MPAIEPRYKQHPHPPYPHQMEDVLRLAERVEPEIGRVIPGCMLVAHEPRVGKTRTVIDAAQLLFERGEIDRVVVVTLNGVKSEWYDPEFGQLRAYSWDNLPHRVFWVHSKVRRWERVATSRPDGRVLDWFVTNYEFVRIKGYLPHVLNLCDDRTILIVDESSAIGSHNSAQSRAVLQIRKRCGWVWELNGTPISDSPSNIYNQARTLSPAILGVKTWTEFRSRWAVCGGPRGNWIQGWHNLDQIQRSMKPYIMRRLKKDCLNLPPRLDPVTIAATMDAETWRVYKELRDEFITFLRDGTTVTAAQAVVRSGRLTQITSGIIGGARSVAPCEDCVGSECVRCDGLGFTQQKEDEAAFGDAKIRALKDWAQTRWMLEPDLKMIVWCRFKQEARRAAVALKELGVPVYMLVGGMPKEEQDRTKRAFHPATAGTGPAALVGNPQTGGVGINLAAASWVIHVSHVPSNFYYEQSNERPHGPGQVLPVAYADMVAEGPNGERTVDHLVLKQLRGKQDVANMMTSAWVEALR